MEFRIPNLNGLNSMIAPPDITAPQFELKPVMFQMLQIVGQFSKMSNKDPHLHLRMFIEVCDTFKIPGVPIDALRIKLFPFSLQDKARAWLNTLPAYSVTSWTDLEAPTQTSMESLLQEYMAKNDAIIQSQQVSLRNLENQAEQLVTALNNKPSGSLPSDTKVPRKEGKEHIKVIELRSRKSVEQHKVSKRPIEDVEPLSGQPKKGKEAIGEEQTVEQLTSELHDAHSTVNTPTVLQHHIPELQKSDGAPDAIARP